MRVSDLQAGIRDQASQPDRLRAALRRFHELYGIGEVRAMRAPARINILGEHVDYVSYLPTASLPFGSHEHEMLMLFRATDDGQISGASMNENFPPFSFALDEEAVESQSQRSWESFVFSRPAPASHWSNYVKGAVQFARWKFGARVDRGFRFLIDSTIPPKSGASSSSALVALSGAAIRHVNQIDFELEELARDSSQAEWYPGTRGGALDHTAICLARRGHAVHISHWDGKVELIPLPDEDFRWITFFTHEADKGREVMLEYNERAAVSRLLIPAVIDDLKRNYAAFDQAWAEALFKLERDVSAACDEIETLLGLIPDALMLGGFALLDPAIFRECETAFPALARDRRDRPLKLRDRALHHLGEMRRVTQAAALLKDASGDAQIELAMRSLGKLINESHESLRDLYEVSTPEVERLVEIVRADPGTYGARLMGGGFGGNVLVLTAAENAQALIERAQAGFYGPRGRDGLSEGSVMISTPGDGLAMLDPDGTL
ncbi:MAG: galactokinase [Blastocatellia bacterium]